MGKYSVPESIRQMKPKGTMVKCISGHYYVYEYSTVTGADGKRHTEMGKAIGSIREGIGFIPNSNFACDTEITSLEFGEYAVTLANSGDTLALLRECFNPEDAVRIYSVAVIHFVQGFTYLKDIKDYYDMSILSLRFPGLKMGYESLTNLYDTLGRRQTNVLKMEQRLVEQSSHETAIDGHVIGCESGENDLAEKGYKFQKLGEEQVNLLMAYDVNTGVPLVSRIYEGASNDKVSVKDFVDQVEMKDMLFIVDRGFSKQCLDPITPSSAEQKQGILSRITLHDFLNNCTSLTVDSSAMITSTCSQATETNILSRWPGTRVVARRLFTVWKCMTGFFTRKERKLPSWNTKMRSLMDTAC